MMTTTCAAVMVGRSEDNFQSQFSATLNSWDGNQASSLGGQGQHWASRRLVFPWDFSSFTPRFRNVSTFTVLVPFRDTQGLSGRAPGGENA